MKTIDDRIAAYPAPGVRLTEDQQKAVAEFVRSQGFDRDIDKVTGVLLGIVAMINHRRGVSPTNTIGYTVAIARRVYGEWWGNG